jgi:hypothetical protein
VLALGGLLAISLVAAGCSKTTAASGSATPPAQAQTSVAPTVELLAPVEGGTVSAGDVTASVKTTGLKFSMPSTTNVAGEGHVHFTLDSQPLQMSAKPEYTFTGVTPGQHKLKAELVQNDAKSFAPPVEQDITFTVK